MFGRKLEEPDPSMPLPTGQVSKPLDMNGWLSGRTLIASDNIARFHSRVGVMAWPLHRTRRNPAPSDPVDVAASRSGSRPWRSRASDSGGTYGRVRAALPDRARPVLGATGAVPPARSGGWAAGSAAPREAAVPPGACGAVSCRGELHEPAGGLRGAAVPGVASGGSSPQSDRQAWDRAGHRSSMNVSAAWTSCGRSGSYHSPAETLSPQPRTNAVLDTWTVGETSTQAPSTVTPGTVQSGNRVTLMHRKERDEWW
jgi:hypothetical protein